MKSDVDRETHDCTLPVQECIRQLNFSRQKLKDVVANAKQHRGHYKVQVSQAILEKRNPRYKEGGIFDPVGNAILVEKGSQGLRKQKNGTKIVEKIGPPSQGSHQTQHTQAK
jgi:hypothetical protein